jgi:hypothetical protein
MKRDDSGFLEVDDLGLGGLMGMVEVASRNAAWLLLLLVAASNLLFVRYPQESKGKYIRGRHFSCWSAK